MGQHTKFRIENHSTEEFKVLINHEKCMYYEKALYRFNNEIIKPKQSFPLSGTIEIEAKASGICAGQESSFIVDIRTPEKDSKYIGHVKLHEKGKYSCKVEGGIRATLDPNKKGEMTLIVQFVSPIAKVTDPEDKKLSKAQ